MPLLWLSIAFIAGILAGKTLPSLRAVSPYLAGFFILWLIYDILKHNHWWRKFIPLPPGLLLALFALGMMRLALALPAADETTLSWYNDHGSYTLTGWVSEPPDVRESGVYLRMSFIEIAQAAVRGNDPFDLHITGDALVRMPVDSAYSLGDTLLFTAEPLTPSSRADFSYRDFLSRHGIYTVIYHPRAVARVGSHRVNPIRVALEKLRQSARETVFSLFPQPESGLLAGILLGLDNDLPASLYQDYRDTGTAHIIAISGFNMTVIAAILLALCSKALNRYWASILTVAGLTLYTLMVGASPSVVRAAVMASVAMGGHLIGRGSAGATALCFTAAVMCLFNPLLVWDASFQLSFAATFGLVLFGSPLRDWAERLIGRIVPEDEVPRVAAPLSDYFLLTLAAQVATLPVIALQFGRLSVSSLLVNPLVLPVQPAVLVLGGAATLSGMLFEPLGKVVASVAWPLLAYTNRMVEWIDGVAPGAISIDSRLAAGLSVLCVAGIFGFIFRGTLKKWFGSLPFAYICLALLAAILSVWTVVLQRPDGKLHLELIRSADALNVLVTSPEGQTLVIDPRGSIDELTNSVSRSKSPFDFHVDAVLLTDRSAAKSISRFNELLPVEKVLLAPSVTLPVEGAAPIQIDPLIPQAALEIGDSITIGKTASLRLLASTQQASALLLEADSCRVLIPGGIDPALLLDLDPSLTSSLTAIFLTPADLVLVPPSWWDRFDAQILIWRDLSIPPDAAWLSLEGAASIELISDGNSYSLLSR